MTLKQFVEQVIGQEEEFTFITPDESIEIRHYCDEGVDHFEYHTVDEQSGTYLMCGVDDALLHEMAQDLFHRSADQVEGYMD